METRRTRPTHTRRFTAAMIVGPVFALMASLLAINPVQAAPPGTPAPVRPLPICERLSDPPTGACPTLSDYFTISSTGALSGATSVQVTVVPSIPPCEVGNSFHNTWSPSLCYSGIQFNRFGFCRYIDQITEEFGRCTVPTYQDGESAGNNLIFESSELAPGSTETRTSCGGTADFGTWAFGGPGNSDPSLDRSWSNLAPNAQTCTISLDRTADNLMGASWHTAGVTLEVRRDGEVGADRESAFSFYILEGTLGPLAPDPNEIPDPDPDPDPDPEDPFTDVRDDSFARSDITLLFDLGIANGVGPADYGPDQDVTREQMAAFLARLWRALGRTCPASSDPFDDVPVASFAFDDAACLFDLGIAAGTAPRTYDPGSNVTREQMAAFLARLWRALGNDCERTTTGFTDVPATSFAAADIECLVLRGITTGTNATTFSPGDRVTREQMAAFLGRLYRAATA